MASFYLAVRNALSQRVRTEAESERDNTVTRCAKIVNDHGAVFFLSDVWQYILRKVA